MRHRLGSVLFSPTTLPVHCVATVDRYATRLQAEKALAAGHGSRLTDTVMLGVQRVSDDEVKLRRCKISKHGNAGMHLFCFVGVDHRHLPPGTEDVSA